MDKRKERPRVSFLLCAATLLCAVLLSPTSFGADASAGINLQDANAFTAHAAKLLGQAMPKAKIEITGPLTLSISGLPGIPPSTATLDSLYSFCRRNPAECEQGLALGIRKSAAAFNQPIAPPTRANLRAIVRQAAYVQAYDKLYGGQGGPVAEKLIGDLWTLCVVDMPSAMQILSASQLPTLKLSRPQALATCKQNVESALPPLAPRKRDYPSPGVNLIAGDPYDASWLIFPERWTGIAESVDGDLLVAAPANDALIYANGRDNDAVAALAAAAAFVAARAQKPLSTAVLRWTPTGWEEAKP